MARSTRLIVAAALALAAAGCGFGVAYHPGYVYYDSYRRPYTYVEYGGGYRTRYVEPGEIDYRGGVAVVRPGYVRPPQAGVYVEGGMGHHEGGGAVVVNGR